MTTPSFYSCYTVILLCYPTKTVSTALYTFDTTATNNSINNINNYNNNNALNIDKTTNATAF